MKELMTRIVAIVPDSTVGHVLRMVGVLGGTTEHTEYLEEDKKERPNRKGNRSKGTAREAILDLFGLDSAKTTMEIRQQLGPQHTPGAVYQALAKLSKARKLSKDGVYWQLPRKQERAA